MLAFFCLGARCRPWRYFAALHSRVFGDGAAPRRTRCSPQPRQHSVFRASGGGVLQVLPSAPFFLRGGRQLFGAGRIQAFVHGKIFTNAFSGGNPWQFFRLMHLRGGFGRENRQFAARFARHASEMSWLWQDMRAMHPKSPANSCLGIHRAKILPGRGAFRCTGPSNHARRADLAIRRGAKPPERPQPRCRRTV